MNRPQLLFTIYPGVSNVTLRMFACTKLQVSGWTGGRVVSLNRWRCKLTTN